MGGITTRLAKILLLGGVVLVVTASSGGAASPARTPMLGVVPHTSQSELMPHALSRAIRAAAPTTLTFDASYQSVIDQFFTDVAHDSGGDQNVYSVATEYSDGSGAIQYQSTFGGSYVARDPLPAGTCNDSNGGLHDPYCLTDGQLQSEIQSVLTAKGWHGGPDHIFFLMTPNGVGSCFDGVSNECSTNDYCAYHSAFVDTSNENVIYANEPYEGPYPGCTGAEQGFPSDVDADTTINTISHEHNEAITDPFGNAWVGNDGVSENGDLCAYGFGTPLGGTPGVSAYNQVINNHHYDLQQEFSNADFTSTGRGCIQRPGGASTPTTFGTPPLVYGGGPVIHTNTTYAIYWLPTAGNTSLPAVTGKAAVRQTLTTSNGSWTAAPTAYSYQWQRCSSTGAGCVDIAGATTTKYTLKSADAGHVVRSTVRATNVNGVSSRATSAVMARVVDVPAVTKAPRIAGRVHVGRKLSGRHGSWTYPQTYRYQWLRCDARGRSCSRIPAATHPTYKLTRRDAGHRLRLRVTVANVAGTKTAVSSATARVH